MSTDDDNKNDIVDTIPNICANCGKGEENSNSLKACTACKLVKYCNRECQIAHRSQHKRACKKRAAELHDEKLFKQPPRLEDCPICFLRMPSLWTGSSYMSCCGKVICCGCIFAPVYDDKGNEVDEKTCPFCRTPAPKSYEEATGWIKKRSCGGDAMAIYNQGCYYFQGGDGYPRNYEKALEFYHRAAELGHAKACSDIGHAYCFGEGVKVDMQKAVHYWELAAIGGDVQARHNLGVDEERAGNINRALKHYMIAAGVGHKKSLTIIRQLHTDGHATKDDYAKALKSYQAYQDEIKSDQRDKAALAGKKYKCI